MSSSYHRFHIDRGQLIGPSTGKLAILPGKHLSMAAEKLLLVYFVPCSLLRIISIRVRVAQFKLQYLNYCVSPVYPQIIFRISFCSRGFLEPGFVKEEQPWSTALMQHRAVHAQFITVNNNNIDYTF